MSHFTVLVIGPDIERQLQPFHEFECTGTNDEYVQDVDVTAEVQKRIDDGESLDDALDWHGLKDRVCASEADIDLDGEHKYGFAVVEKVQLYSAKEIENMLQLEGISPERLRAAAEAVIEEISEDRLVRAVNRTNPNKRWDWWVLGGRWSGKLLLKPGVLGSRSPNGGVDQARKGDVDFEEMRARASARAEQRWRDAHAIIAGRTWRSWDEVRASAETIDQAREIYNGQPVLRDFRQSKDFCFDGPDEFAVTLDQYVTKARAEAIQAFAVVKDGEWHERGTMGWFACVSDEKDPAEWTRQFNALIEDLPDDTLLSVVDCHI